jgi:hypothetical protein
MGRGGVFYWILTIIAGIYIILTPKAFESKFHLHYPDNIYIGILFLVVGAIGLFWKFRNL